MSYLGREELASSYIDYFEEYQEQFIENIKSAYIINKLKYTKTSEDIYISLFNMLLVKECDHSQIQEFCSSQDFDKPSFFEAIIKMQADFARHLISQGDNKSIFLSSLNFACERFAVTMNQTSTSQTQGNTSTLKFSSSGGFLIHEDFFDAMRKIAAANEQLEFLNLYNGVPIRTFSKSIKVDNDTIIVQLELTQILAMKEEGCAYIVNNKHISNNLKANILWVNTTTHTVALNKLETQPYMHALKRKYPRVHPNKFTKVELKHEDGRIAVGKLFDISEGGIGVVSTEDVGFKKDDILTTDIELHSSEGNIFLHLSFRLVVLISYQNAYRYCLEALPNQKDTALIEGFAKEREIQTIEELNALIEQYRS